MNNQEAIACFKEANSTLRNKGDMSMGVDRLIARNELAITALEAQQADMWIPVSSGNLPNIEYIRDIWVTARRKGYKERVVMRLNWNYRRFQHTNGKEISELWEVLAWKPLEYPTPYKEEQA